MAPAVQPWAHMGLLTALFSALSKKMGDILQALFGWSVAALFGRLDSRTQLIVTGALVLSLFWPVFVVGVFVPSAVTFFLAFVPIENPVVHQVLRIVWLVLAVIAPIIVGLLVRAAAPLKKRHSVGAAMLGGYPLALGMALSFIITAITVPMVKLVTLARGWKEEHIFVQSKELRYDAVILSLVRATEMTGLVPGVEDVPLHLSLATRLMKFFARGAIDSMLTQHPRRVMATGLELWLYPADLMIRGESEKLAAIRARISVTRLERDAWLVQEKKAQALQDELGRLWEVLDVHDDDDDPRAVVRKRLEEIVAKAGDTHEIQFADWMILDRIARRIETEVEGTKSLVDKKIKEPIYGERKHLAHAARQIAPLPERASVLELVKGLATETTELARLESELAQQEAMSEVAGVARSAVSMALVIALIGAALSLAAFAAVLAFDAQPRTALIVAGGFLGLTLIAALIGYASIPKDPLARTRKRLGDELKMLRERAS